MPSGHTTHRPSRTISRTHISARQTAAMAIGEAARPIDTMAEETWRDMWARVDAQIAAPRMSQADAQRMGLVARREARREEAEDARWARLEAIADGVRLGRWHFVCAEARRRAHMAA